MAAMRACGKSSRVITIAHGSHAALGVAGVEDRSHNNGALLCWMHILPESPVQQHVPLWMMLSAPTPTN
jgi:hypothetical protein